MKICISILLISLSLLSEGASAQTVTIEAEDFTAYYNIKGDDIEANILDGNGFLSGLDAPGEWAEYRFLSTAAGGMELSIRLRGEEETLFDLNLVLIPSEGGENRTVNFEYSGSGFS